MSPPDVAFGEVSGIPAHLHSDFVVNGPGGLPKDTSAVLDLLEEKSTT